MKTKVIIHPAFETFRESITAIPSHLYQVEQTFCNQRNSVEQITINHQKMVVKKYKRPTIANCFIYTFFRKSKAQRSYEYAQKLLEYGVETAHPIAYILNYKNGFFHTGYFISEYLPYPSLHETKNLEKREALQIGSDFIDFTAHLHKKGILHKDYNPGNILYYKKENKYHFALVDINRVSFGKLTMRQCIKPFTQLGVQLEYLLQMILNYSKLRNWNTNNALITYLLMSKRLFLKKTIKKKVKSLRVDS